MWEYGFSQTSILPYKDKIVDFVLIWKNTDQWEPVFSHILCTEPKVGRPLSIPSHGSAKKRRKVSYSVPDSIRLQNTGAHYIIYMSEWGRCEVCPKRSNQSRSHSKCYMCNVFLRCNEKKNCFKEFHNL